MRLKVLPLTWIPLLSNYTRIRYAVILLGLIALFFNYKYSVTTHLGLSQVNGFIDFVFSSSDLFVIFVFGLFVLVRYRLAQYFFVISAVPVLVAFCLHHQFVPLWQWLETIARISVYCWIFIESNRSLGNSNLARAVKTVFLSGFGFLSLFDYYLISDSLIPTILIIVFLFISTPKSNSRKFNAVVPGLLTTWFLINSATSIFQLFTGHSLGLKYFGEPYVQVLGDGIARQIVPFVNSIIIRPYGLTAHPNVLGGVSLLGIFVSYFKPFKYFFGSWSKWVLIMSIITFALSMSRNAYLALALCSVVYLLSYNQSVIKKYYRYLLSASVGVASLMLVALTSLTRLETSDVYRVNDTIRFFNQLPEIPLWNYILGLGLGQYPQYLYNRGGLAAWEYQPVHNVPLYLLSSFGIVPICIIAYFLYLSTQRKQQFDSRLPRELYIQWYDSSNEERMMELTETLKSNISKSLFSTIHVFYEANTAIKNLKTLSTSQTKLNFVQTAERSRFSDFYKYAAGRAEHTMVVANSDILFDSSLDNLYTRPEFATNKLVSKELLVALTRYENNHKLMPEGRYDYGGEFYSHSQDVWITSSKNKLLDADFELGSPGCDQRLALAAVARGYSIIDPYMIIRVMHNHSSAVRSYQINESSYKGARLFPTEKINNYSIIWE